jgi:O-acetyl-ADP-ribose deacetylase (regulator of RNase III)
MADKHHLESIALPAFGTGVGGFPVAQCARLMIDAIRAHAPQATSLHLVRLVLFGRPAYEAFSGVAGETFGQSHRT